MCIRVNDCMYSERCARDVRVYTNKYVKRMYIYTWWLCKCVSMCVLRALFFFVCMYVYHNNSMYTILSRIILIAYQASLLSDGIKSKISKLAKKKIKRKKNHYSTSWSGTRIHDRYFFDKWIKYLLWTLFLFFLLPTNLSL